MIDESRIGVVGHSQGGFTALWVAGAKINPEKYLAFQRGWRSNPMVPDYLRSELPLDDRIAGNRKAASSPPRRTVPHRPLPRLRGRDREGARNKAHLSKLTPSPTLPRKREREQTEFAARVDSIWRKL